MAFDDLGLGDDPFAAATATAATAAFTAAGAARPAAATATGAGTAHELAAGVHVAVHFDRAAIR